MARMPATETERMTKLLLLPPGNGSAAAACAPIPMAMESISECDRSVSCCRRRRLAACSESIYGSVDECWTRNVQLAWWCRV